MNFRFKISGASETAAVLRRLPGAVSRKVLVKAARAGANVFRDEAKKRAPPAHPDHDRLHPGLPHLEKAMRVKVVEARPNRVTLAAHTGAAFWGNYKEFGTARQAADPFMRPAFDAGAGAALKATGTVLGKGTEEEAAKLAGPYLATRAALLRRR